MTTEVQDATREAISLAMFYRATVVEAGTAADGGAGAAWEYDPDRRFPGRPWRTAGAPAAPTGAFRHQHETLVGRYSRDELPEWLEPLGFEACELSYCDECGTRYGCQHHHADDVRIGPGGPTVRR